VAIILIIFLIHEVIDQQFGREYSVYLGTWTLRGGAYVRPWALGSATKVHKKIIRKNHSFQQSNQRLEQSTLHAVDATSVNMLKTRLNKTWKDMGSYSW